MVAGGLRIPGLGGQHLLAPLVGSGRNDNSPGKGDREDSDHHHPGRTFRRTGAERLYFDNDGFHDRGAKHGTDHAGNNESQPDRFPGGAFAHDRSWPDRSGEEPAPTASTVPITTTSVR